jgi:hypothetical protein
MKLMRDGAGLQFEYLNRYIRGALKARYAKEHRGQIASEMVLIF